jgi:hypothetical protein
LLSQSQVRRNNIMQWNGWTRHLSLIRSIPAHDFFPMSAS